MNAQEKEIKLLPITQNDHFIHWASLIRQGYWLGWTQHHTAPFWTLVKSLSSVIFVDAKKFNKTEILSRFVDLIVTMKEADTEIWWRDSDMNWFVEVLDSEDAKVTLAMLMAYSSAPDDYFTPAEVAEATATENSGWRKKCGDGEIPGAVKKGKQWLIPGSYLRLRGIVVKKPSEDSEPDEQI